LVLDEPAAGLDPRGREAIFENIRDYQRKSGRTVVIVSHSMEDMARYCDSLVVMSKGEVVLSGNCEEVFSSAELLQSVGLDIPQVTRLMLELRKKGIDVDRNAYTVEDAFEQIIKLYKNN